MLDDMKETFDEMEEIGRELTLNPIRYHCIMNMIYYLFIIIISY